MEKLKLTEFTTFLLHSISSLFCFAFSWQSAFKKISWNYIKIKIIFFIYKYFIYGQFNKFIAITLTQETPPAAQGFCDIIPTPASTPTPINARSGFVGISRVIIPVNHLHIFPKIPKTGSSNCKGKLELIGYKFQLEYGSNKYDDHSFKLCLAIELCDNNRYFSVCDRFGSFILLFS